MDRRKFIRTSCIGCSSIGFLSAMLQSCVSVKYATGTLTQNGLTVDLKDMKARHDKNSYVIVRHEELQYPICVYQVETGTYTALLMRCTHQGAELQASGDQLTCAAHGSEFDKWGRVVQGPASENLRSFPVSVTGDQLFIDLRKPVS